jgi:hypothetical protein
MKGRTAAGEFEGDGVVPLRGSAERSEAPRGELDSRLEVSRLCERLWKGIFETGHWVAIVDRLLPVLLSSERGFLSFQVSMRG